MLNLGFKPFPGPKAHVDFSSLDVHGRLVDKNLRMGLHRCV